jgi:hypothetical protein
MSQRLRLLAVNHTTLFAGAEQNLCDLLIRLPTEQVDVLGVVAPGRGPLAERLAELDVPAFDLPVPHLAGARSPIPFARGLARWAGFTRRFGDLLATLVPDVVYASSPHAAIAVEPALSRARLPWIWQMPDLVRPTRFNRLALRRALRRSDRIVAISEATASSLRALGADGRRIDLVYCAVDPAAFRRSPTGGAEVRQELGVPADAPVVGMFGQITNGRVGTFWSKRFPRLAPLTRAFIFCSSGVRPGRRTRHTPRASGGRSRMPAWPASYGGRGSDPTSRA